MTAGRYLAACLVASAALAVVALPWTADDPEHPRDLYRTTIRAAEERFGLHSELLRREHSRSVARAAAAQAANDARRFVVLAGDAQPALAERARLYASVSLAGLPRNAHEVRVVITFATDTSPELAGVPVTRAGGGLTIDAFPPGSVDAHLCVVVVRVHANVVTLPGIPWPQHRRRLLTSSCWWYAAYGRPGRGVSAWLDSTQFAAVKNRTGMNLAMFGGDEIGELLALDRFSTGDASFPRLAACGASIGNACTDLLLHAPTRGEQAPHTVVYTSGWLGAGRNWTHDGNRLATSLLAQLEHELGPTGFAAFWRSNDDVPVAFAAARGEPLETWVRDQVTPPRSRYHPGPDPDPRMAIGLLLLIPGMLALGVRAVVRRGNFSQGVE